MVLNDQPNCQVSRILMSSQPIHIKTLREELYGHLCNFVFLDYLGQIFSQKWHW
jgi:hypothetical protein